MKKVNLMNAVSNLIKKVVKSEHIEKGEQHASEGNWEAADSEYMVAHSIWRN